MDINSDEDEDYGYMGHGEGVSLDQYPVLPNIQPSLKRKDKIADIKIATTPLSVLPPIAAQQELIPCPPSTSKQSKTRRRRAARKSLSQLTESDLHPSSQFVVLPEIKKDVPAILRVKQQISDVSINRSNGQINFYKILPCINSVKNKISDVKSLATGSTYQNDESKQNSSGKGNVGVLKLSSSSKELVGELQADLSPFRNEMHHYTSMFGTGNVQCIDSSQSTSSLDSTSEEVIIDNYTASDIPTMRVESGIQRVKSRMKLMSRAGSRVGGRNLKNSTLTSLDLENGKYIPAPPKVAKQSKTGSKENAMLKESGYASICTKFNSGGT